MDSCWGGACSSYLPTSLQACSAPHDERKEFPHLMSSLGLWKITICTSEETWQGAILPKILTSASLRCVYGRMLAIQQVAAVWIVFNLRRRFRKSDWRCRIPWTTWKTDWRTWVRSTRSSWAKSKTEDMKFLIVGGKDPTNLFAVSLKCMEQW